MNLQTLKGFRDFLPNEARKRQYVIDSLKELFTLYGFEPLETPVLEYQEILTGKYGDEGEKLMYKFLDNGDRKVAMRYDQTVPLARVAAQYQNDIIFPFKRYQIQNVWRAENTQKGRYREFLQVDVDTIGSNSLLTDAEIIKLAIDSYMKLGFKEIKLLINDRNVFSELGKNNFEPSKLPAVIRAIDKLEKIGEKNVSIELSEQIGKESAKRVLDQIKNQKPTKLIKEIFEYLDKMGVPSNTYEFSPTLARGLDYYTGSIFEIKCDQYLAGSLGGGGRYDKLVGLFSKKDIPAVGFAFGFDRTMEAMNELNLFPKSLDKTRLLITNTSSRSPKIAAEIRNLGINSDLYIENKSLDKQLKYANKKNYQFVLIVNDDTLILKNMIEGKQENISLEKLPNVLS